MGLRYFVHRRPLPELRREADIVFPRARIAVFVDGCFWHGCEEHGRTRHVENPWYWPEKIASNKRRDRDTDEKLAAARWRAIRIWEHDDVVVAAARVADEIDKRAKCSVVRPSASRGPLPHTTNGPYESPSQRQKPPSTAGH